MQCIAFYVDKIFHFSIRNKQTSSKRFFASLSTLISGYLLPNFEAENTKSKTTSLCVQYKSAFPWKNTDFIATYALILDNGLTSNYSSHLMDLAEQHFPTVYTVGSRQEWNSKHQWEGGSFHLQDSQVTQAHSLLVAHPSSLPTCSAWEQASIYQLLPVVDNSPHFMETTADSHPLLHKSLICSMQC